MTADGVHRLLRRLLPRPFRQRHGEAMGDAFAAALREAREGGGRPAVVRLWLGETWDLARTGLVLRLARADRRPRTEVPPRRGAGRSGGTREGGTSPRWPGRRVRSVADDLGFAARSLRRHPAHALLAVGTLSLGVGAATAIFSALEATILNPLPIPGGERVVAFWRPVGGTGLVSPAAEQVDVWAEQRDLFEVVERFAHGNRTLTGVGEPRHVRAGLIRPTFHELVAAPPLLGRSFAEDELTGEGARVILLSHGLWSSTFGKDPSVLGASVTLDGEPWAVIGVMPPRVQLPDGMGIRTDLWMPLGEAAAPAGQQVVARMRPDVSLEQVQTRLDRIRDEAVARGEPADRWQGTVRKPADMVGIALQDVLKVLVAAVVLLLLIACVNVSSLLLSRALTRRHETAVRMAVGAGKGRLVQQLLLESLLLGASGGAVGIALAQCGIRAMAALRPERLAALDAARIHGGVLLFASGVCVTAALAFGMAPAWHAVRAGGLDRLRAGGPTDESRSGRLRWGLVVAQLALSFALLVGSLLVVRHLVTLQRQEVGFRPEGLALLHVRLPAWEYADTVARRLAWGRMLEVFRRLDGVERVSMASGAPGRSGISFGTPEVEGAPAWEESEVFFGPAVDAGYFRTVDQRILAGRGFTEEEVREGLDVYVLGESAARRLFGDGEVVGRRFRLGGGEWHTVVGVARDVKMTGLSTGGSGRLQIYAPVREAAGELTFLLRARGKPEALLGALRRGALEVEPAALVELAAPMEDLLLGTLDRERFTTMLLGLFAALAVLLSTVGLYGVASQVVGQRTREIGIRVSLGARAWQIRRMILVQGARATLVGVALGALLALVGARLLESRVFGLDGAAPGVFLVAAFLLSLTTLAATYAPAARAARIHPVQAMRVEWSRRP